MSKADLEAIGHNFDIEPEDMDDEQLEALLSNEEDFDDIFGMHENAAQSTLENNANFMTEQSSSPPPNTEQGSMEEFEDISLVETNETHDMFSQTVDISPWTVSYESTPARVVNHEDLFKNTESSAESADDSEWDSESVYSQSEYDPDEEEDNRTDSTTESSTESCLETYLSTRRGGIQRDKDEVADELLLQRRSQYGTNLHTGWDPEGRFVVYLPTCSWLPMPLVLSREDIEDAAEYEEVPVLILTTPGGMMCWLNDGAEYEASTTPKTVDELDEEVCEDCAVRDVRGTDGLFDGILEAEDEEEDGGDENTVQQGASNIWNAVKCWRGDLVRFLTEPVIRI
jgi:hypothetical protein